MLTSGGDCPGLNAVIRAVVKCAAQKGWEVYGIPYGTDGFMAVVEGRTTRMRLGRLEVYPTSFSLRLGRLDNRDQINGVQILLGYRVFLFTPVEPDFTAWATSGKT